MRTSRAFEVLTVVGALAVAACRTPATTAPSAVSLKPAPTPIIRASITGGGIHRQVGAEFSTDSDAYVLVGHVGGDGRIRVLFPDNASQTGRVKGGTRYVINSFEAGGDANPSLYSLSQPPTRSVGAKMDSYDGAGSAFLFVISGAEPLVTDVIADDDGSWDTYMIPGYWYGIDPRAEIERFAEQIGGGKPYKLEFAHYYNTTKYSSLSDKMFDCAVNSGFGFGDYGQSLYGRRPWIANYFGNDLGYWDLNDDYAGLGGCGGNYGYAGYPGMYAYAYDGEPITTPLPKHYVRVLHLPLVSTRSLAYRRRNSDPVYIDQSDRSSGSGSSRSGGYSTRRSGDGRSAGPRTSGGRAPAARSQPSHKQ